MRWLTHMDDKLMLVVGTRLQFLTMWTSPEGCLNCSHNMTPGFPQSDSRERGDAAMSLMT